MPQINITREQGHIVGFGEKGERAYKRFKCRVNDLAEGELLTFQWTEPRSPGFHRMFFVMLNNLFQHQEQFIDEDQLRSWLTVGAGYADFFPGPKGRLVALPRSIAWDKMEEQEFRELVRDVWAFLRTEHAQAFLWPQASPEARKSGVEQMLMEYEG